MNTIKLKKSLPYWELTGEKNNQGLIGVNLVFGDTKRFAGYVGVGINGGIAEIEADEYNILLNLECYYSSDIAVRILSQYVFALDYWDRVDATKTIPFHSKIVKYSFGTVKSDIVNPKEVIVLEIEDNVATCAEISVNVDVDGIDIGLYQLNQIQPIQRNITPECIRSVRYMLGLSQIEFASFLGFKHAKNDTKLRQVDDWESGKKIPNMSTQEILKYVKVHGAKGEFVRHLKHNC